MKCWRGCVFLVRNRKNGKTGKAINSSKRESYIEYICSWIEAGVYVPFQRQDLSNTDD